MPSKGSPKIVFRPGAERLAWLRSRVEWSQTDRRDGPLDMTALLNAIIDQARDKQKRSASHRRKPKGPKRAADSDPVGARAPGDRPAVGAADVGRAEQ